MDLYLQVSLQSVVAQDPDWIDGDLNVITAVALRFSRGIRGLPADLAGVIAFTLVTNVVVLAPIIRETPIRILVGLPFVLFIPGYAFIAALFPEKGESPVSADEQELDEASVEPVASEQVSDRGIDGIERVALSLGLSIAIVPLIGLVLNFTPWGIRLVPILVSVSGFTLLSTAVAAHRRWVLPEEVRFSVPYKQWLSAGRNEFLAPDTRADAVLNVMLAVSIVLAMSSVGYAVLIPQQGESFSELYLLTEEDDGELVADDYPTNFTQGEEKELIVGVSNQEHEPTNYTLLVQLQRVRTQDNSTTMLRSDQLHEFDIQLAHNETWHRTHSISPTFEGTNLRLTYLLYRGQPPASPTVNNSYREVHLWVNVAA